MTKHKSNNSTIRDVAKIAEVSVATVSNYINQKTPVSFDVSARIEAAIAQLNYVPHSTARRLATHKTHTIGLLTMDIAGDFYTPLLSGIEAIARENGLDLLITSVRDPQRRQAFPPPIGPQNTDGALVFADSLSTETLQRLAQANFPVVLIHRSAPEGMSIPCVTIENKAASYALVEHLITIHNRREIVFLQGPEGQEDSLWREQGYREALAAHQLPYQAERVIAGEFDRQIAYASMLKLLASGVTFDAVFAGDDDSAVGALTALKESGKRVPEEVAVVGFDDQRMAPFLSPPLTTVRAPTETVGREAARQLINLIHNRPAESLLLLPTEIVIRQSCGCPAR